MGWTLVATSDAWLHVIHRKSQFQGRRKMSIDGRLDLLVDLMSCSFKKKDNNLNQEARSH